MRAPLPLFPSLLQPPTCEDDLYPFPPPSALNSRTTSYVPLLASALVPAVPGRVFVPTAAIVATAYLVSVSAWRHPPVVAASFVAADSVFAAASGIADPASAATAQSAADAPVPVEDSPLSLDASKAGDHSMAWYSPECSFAQHPAWPARCWARYRSAS